MSLAIGIGISMSLRKAPYVDQPGGLWDDSTYWYDLTFWVD